MGLSNEERYMRVLWSIKSLYDLLPQLEDYEKRNHCQTTNLSPLIRRMWSTMLSDEGNKDFWIFGSCMTDDRLNPNTVWHAALVSHAEEIQEHVSQILRQRDGIEFDEDDERDDDFRYGKNHLPSLESILYNSEDGPYYASVINVYMEIENCQYALNRYHDAFAEKFDDMRKLCADIMGVCFSIFSSNRVFYEAYLLEVIKNKIVQGSWDSKKNLIFALFKKFNLQYEWHVENRDDFALARLMVMWKDIQNRKLTSEEKVRILLKIAGRVFATYSYIKEDFLNFLKAYNKQNKDKVRLEVIEEEIRSLASSSGQKKTDEDSSHDIKSDWVMDLFSLSEDDIGNAENYQMEKSNRISEACEKQRKGNERLMRENRKRSNLGRNNKKRAGNSRTNR